jgi:hypothetical protein
MLQMTSPVITDGDWALLLKRIRDKTCVPFLGAGASMGFEGDVALPTASELAAALAKESSYPGLDKSDFLRVCQYYELVFDKKALRDEISKRLKKRDVKPGVVHKALAALPLPCVLTTNYDNLMERAFEEQGKRPVTVIYDVHGDATDLPNPTEMEPLVYKFHGSLERPTTMVCTEDDVIQFLSSLINGIPPLPSLIKRSFMESSILFIGYGLKDWNIRVMLRALRASRPEWANSFAVQRRPVGDDGLAGEWDTSVLYWDRREKVRCFDIDAIKFIEDLAMKYESLRDIG